VQFIGCGESGDGEGGLLQEFAALHEETSLGEMRVRGLRIFSHEAAGTNLCGR
jgi:hypothetical protein